MSSQRAGCLPGAAVLIVACLAAVIALGVTACGGTSSPEPPAPETPPPDSPFWTPPPYAGFCEADLLCIEADSEAQQALISDVLLDMDIPLMIAAALCDPATRTAYDADEAGTREELFRWTLLSRYLDHFAPEGQVELGAKTVAGRELVEHCWDAWLRRSAGEGLPAIPSPLSGTVRYTGQTYEIEPSDGVYPEVALVLAYLDEDPEGREFMTFFADVTREAGDVPYTVVIDLLRRADGVFVLHRVGAAHPEDEVYDVYTLTSYNAEVYVPVEFALVDRTEQFASFAAPAGLTLDIFEEAFAGTLSDRHLREVGEIGEALFDFTSDHRLEYGLIWDDGTGIRYHLVRLMEPGRVVCVQASIAYAWAADYYMLAESVFTAFGSEEFPINVILGLEDYILAGF